MRISETRWLLLGAAALIAGCHDRSPAGPVPVPVQTTNVATAIDTVDDDGRVDCASTGVPDFRHVCDVERGDGGLLTLRNPDGGFHRVRITNDGHGVVAADGAEQAEVRVAGDRMIEVTLGGDRYRLPATIRPHATH